MINNQVCISTSLREYANNHCCSDKVHDVVDLITRIDLQESSVFVNCGTPILKDIIEKYIFIINTVLGDRELYDELLKMENERYNNYKAIQSGKKLRFHYYKQGSKVKRTIRKISNL